MIHSRVVLARKGGELLVLPAILVIALVTPSSNLGHNVARYIHKKHPTRHVLRLPERRVVDIVQG
jgi:hypothetical protein